MSLNSVIRDENRKSRNTRSTGKFGLGVQNEAGQRLRVLPRERTGHSKHPLPTTQEKVLHVDITRWSIPKDGEALYSHQKQDKEQTMAQTIRDLPAVQEMRVQSLDWKDPLEKGMATHSSILAWRIP